MSFQCNSVTENNTNVGKLHLEGEKTCTQLTQNRTKVLQPEKKTDVVAENITLD